MENYIVSARKYRPSTFDTVVGQRALTTTLKNANATNTAILSANYLAACFKDTYGIVYTGATGFVGHEMILD